jgi:hypothetical protein
MVLEEREKLRVGNYNMEGLDSPPTLGTSYLISIVLDVLDPLVPSAPSWTTLVGTS